jgi:GxxExxY protein
VSLLETGLHANKEMSIFIKRVLMTENDLSRQVVDICFRIHNQYGPGLFESVYEEIFCYEWHKTGRSIQRQEGIKVIHEGIDMRIGFIPDLIVGGKVILELKSVELLAEVHHKQLLTYLRLTNLKLGLLINFNVPLIKNGIHRIVNKL